VNLSSKRAALKKGSDKKQRSEGKRKDVSRRADGGGKVNTYGSKTSLSWYLSWAKGVFGLFEELPGMGKKKVGRNTGWGPSPKGGR